MSRIIFYNIKSGNVPTVTAPREHSSPTSQPIRSDKSVTKTVVTTQRRANPTQFPVAQAKGKAAKEYARPVSAQLYQRASWPLRLK